MKRTVTPLLTLLLIFVAARPVSAIAPLQNSKPANMDNQA